MPQRNTIRVFAPDSPYHCYNRGVEKRRIFLDEQDYGVFLQRLKMMLANPDELRQEYANRELVRSFHGDVELLAYCLMPNHFHLLLYQHSADALPEFMRTLSTSYTMYFNKRYERVGSLFQGKYRARLVNSDEYNLHISRYIHLNPLNLEGSYQRYPYSSFRFLREPEIRPEWLSVHKLLGLHNESFEQYDAFVREYIDPDDFEYLADEFSLD